MKILLTPRVTAPFGAIDSTHPTPHTGVDVALPEGSPIYAPADGIVSRIADYGDGSLGQAVFVKTQAGYQYIMGHLSKVQVHAGDRVHAGDLLALSGNTGNSTGPHVHLGLVDKAGGFLDPQLGPLGKLVEKAVGEAKAGATEHVRSATYDVAMGILEGVRDVLVDLSYSVCLIGGGLCIILHVAGWRDGGRWAGLLATAFALIKYVLG